MNALPIEPAELQRYRVRQRREIEQILAGLVAQKSTLTVSGDTDAAASTLSLVLKVDAGQVWLDPSSDAVTNQRLLRSGYVTCVGKLGEVQVQFVCRDLKLLTHAQQGVMLAAPFPVECYRLQRRESYRLATSLIKPVKCLIHKSGRLIETVVVDISVGGVGVLAYKEDGVLASGESFHSCRIAIPAAGEFPVSLLVRSTFDTPRPDGRPAHRAGCQFLDLPESVETQIQRYIIRVERERSTRFT